MITSKFANGFKETKLRLKRYSSPERIKSLLDKFGKIGVEKLQEFTPKDTGKTSKSWTYKINRFGDKWRLSFLNENTTDEGESVAILILYGHATKRGSWIEGVNYIDPALEPVFAALKDEIWKEV